MEVFSPNQLYTAKEAAKRLRIHYVSMRRMINDGRIKATKPAQRWLIKGSTLNEYIEKMTSKPHENKKVNPGRR